MKNKFIPIVLSLFLVFIFSFSTNDPQLVTIRVKKGDMYGCEIKLNMDLQTEMPDMFDMEIQQENVIRQTMLVDDVFANGNVSMKFLVNGFYMKQYSPMLDTSIFDTDHPENNRGAVSDMIAEKMGNMKGLKYTIEVDKFANLINDNINEAYEAAGLGSSGSNSSQHFIPLPNFPVKLGKSYSQKVAVGMSGFSMESDTKYKIVDITANELVLDVKSKYKRSKGKNTITSLKGGATGKIRIDIKTGIPIKSQMNQDVTMVMDSNGKDIVMHMKTLIETTYKKM